MAIAVLSTVAFFAVESKQTPNLFPTQLANIEALANPEGGGVTLLRCKPKKGATCYVVSDGQILDKQKINIRDNEF